MIEFEKFENVWFALAKSDAEAVNLTMRSQLMMAVKDAVRSWKLGQTQAAKRLGITRPRLNDLLRGKIGKFSLDALSTLATRAGLTVKMSVKKAAVKRAA